MATIATRTKRAFVDTPDGQIHYVYAGSGDPILLLHQTPASTTEYAEMIPILARTNLVVAMDTMGYGDSDTPPREYTLEDYARTVPMLLDQMGIERATLVGHHTGSFVAAEVAVSYPERVEAMVLSGFFNMDADERARNVGMWVQWYAKADGSHLVEMWQSAMRQSGDDVEGAQRRVMNVLKGGTTGEYGHWAVVAWSQEDRLPLIQCPTLLIWGAKDLEVLDSMGWQANADKHKVGQAIRRCREVEYAEGTSAFPVEMPEEFSRLVVEFMKDPGL